MFKVQLPALLSVRVDRDYAGWKESLNGESKRGFPVFELTLVLALLLISWVAYKLYEIVPDSDETRNQLTSLKSEYFRITQVVQSNLDEMDGIFTNYFETK